MYTPGKLAIDRYGGIVDERGERLLISGVAFPCGIVHDDHVGNHNAMRLVKCWNAHDELLEACKTAVNGIETAVAIGSCASAGLVAVHAILLNAIAKAEGR